MTKSLEATIRTTHRVPGVANCRICQSTNIQYFCSAFDRVLGRRDETWDILQCKRCRFGWTSPTPVQAHIRAYYPPTYLGDVEKRLDEFFSGRLLRSRSWREEVRKVRLVERHISKGRILDVGCGDGKFLWALNPNRWERAGVDISTETVALVQSRMPSIQLIAGNIYSEQLNEGTFDAMTFWHVLEHLPDLEEILTRTLNLLKPNGWLFVSLPNIDSLQSRLFRRHWYGFGDVPRHLYHFSKRSLELLLRQAGFQVRRHVFFSRSVNFHSLKHSLLSWSTERFGNRLAYYTLKPLLLTFPPLEMLTGKYGIVTTVGQKRS